MEVFLIAAQSLDGFIAKDHKESSTNWTSPEDTHFFRQMTKKAQVVIYGSTTYQTIPAKYRPLKHRLNIVYSRQTEPSIQSSPQNMPMAEDAQGQTGLFTTNMPPQQLIEIIARKGYQSVAICGGRSIYNLFLDSGLVNTLYLTVEPIIFGHGIKLFDKPLTRALQLEEIQQLSKQTFVLKYRIQ